MKIHYSKLSGIALDWLVARILGKKVYTIEFADITSCRDLVTNDVYSPTTKWEQGGPLIEEYRIRLNEGNYPINKWKATLHPPGLYYEAEADTALDAAMKVIVRYKLGEQVTLPGFLVSKTHEDWLKPCPFCGGEAKFDYDDHGWNWITCSGCGVMTDGRTHAMDDCKPLLIEEWNRRHNALP